MSPGPGSESTNRSAHLRRHDAGGFTLVEVLVSMVALSMIAVAVTGIIVTLMMQFSNGASERLAEGTTAQWASMTFARDVQGSAGVDPECAPGSGTRLITFKSSDAGPGIEYRVRTTGSNFSLHRVRCGPGEASHRVVGDLTVAPTVTCDGSDCVNGTNPRIVTLHVARSSKFGFTLDGVRRTTDVIPEAVQVPSFVSLGGSKPLSITGSGKLTILGDAFVNNPGATAVTVANSGLLNIAGNLVIQKGANPGPVLIATGNPSIHVAGTGPAASEINVCSWCDIKIPASSSGVSPTAIVDPFKFLPAPDTVGVTTQTSCPLKSGVYVCQPGVYTGAFPPTSPGDAKFRLEPGHYTLRGGFTLGNSRSVESNGGVLFYVESGAITIQGDTQLSVSAPTTGPYAGLLFFQPAGNTSPFNISNGGRVSALSGAIYAPGATSLNLSSGAGTLKISQVIGQNISITNSGEVIVGGS